MKPSKLPRAVLLACTLPLTCGVAQAATLIHAGTVITAEGEQILKKTNHCGRTGQNQSH